MSALLATVQGRTAFRAVAVEIDARGQGSGAVPTAGSSHGLHEPGQARTGDIKGWPGSLGTRAISAVAIKTARTTVALLIASLFVLAIAFHWQILYSSTCNLWVKQALYRLTTRVPINHRLNVEGDEWTISGISRKVEAGGLAPRRADCFHFLSNME